MSKKYHVALSFAGEDRSYVDKVANTLKAEGVDLFYDKFDEVDLWGKDLYAHLSEIYQNRAMYTVMFVSEHYKQKLWTNHERRSAQARAFTESREYILPAFFDKSVEVPGLLKTTGHIDLTKRSPEDFASLIVKKLHSAGVALKQSFSYSNDAKADVDFPLKAGDPISALIKAMRSYNWYTQAPAVEKTLSLDWGKVKPDQTFVLGRNLYQCACGEERAAEAFLRQLRKELASIPLDRALDLLNGMFFEVYFNSSGEFRSVQIKGKRLDKLLAIQSVKKYEPSVLFIQRALEPYRMFLPYLPSTTPQHVVIELGVKLTSPPVLSTLAVGGRSLLHKNKDGENPEGRVWRLSYREFQIDELQKELAAQWFIPEDLLEISIDKRINSKTKITLPEGVGIRWPMHI